MHRLLFLLILLFNCSDQLITNDSIEWIKDLTVDINRLDNELYIQVETSSGISLVNPSLIWVI